MDDIRNDLKWIFRAVAIVGFVVLAICYPFLWSIIGWVVLIIVGFMIYAIYDSTGDRYMKRKFGKDFQKAIDDGQLSMTKAYPCVPDGHYTSKNAVEEKCNIVLPDFDIKECRETLPDFSGDYGGCADIEFTNVINNRVIQQIEDDMKQEFSKWRKGEGDGEYVCDMEKPDLDVKPSKDVYWRISILKETNKGKIVYGRV